MPLHPAYIAGIMDGEGCIGLYFRPERRHIKPLIRIVNTNREIIDMLATEFGGYITITKADGIRKEKYTWSLTNLKSIQNFLSTIYSYLTIKRPQATKMLMWCEYRLNGSYNKKYTERDLQLIDEYKIMNQRGGQYSSASRFSENL